MPEVDLNGVRLYYELHGEGEPLVLVHGSWGDATGWQLVVPGLAESFHVLVYDRRGHSRSGPADTPGTIHDDGDDLAALLEALELAPAHVVTNSWGGNIALLLAARRPELFRSLSCHEPPQFALLAGDPEGERLLQQGGASLQGVAGRIASGDHEGAARQFVEEVAFGPGAWDNEVPPEGKEIMIRNAPTFLGELQDPDQFGAGEDALARLEIPVRFTDGSESPPIFALTIERLVKLVPSTTRETIEGAAHMPQMQAPERYVGATARAVGRA